MISGARRSSGHNLTLIPNLFLSGRKGLQLLQWNLTFGQHLEYRETYIEKLAQETTANHAVDAAYYYDFDITIIDAWRICLAKRKDMSNDPSPQQKQYHAHYGPMVIEKWALLLFKKYGFQPASICTAARTDIECACCQVCNYPGGLEPVNSEPPNLDMYVCKACLRELGCYTDEQRQEVQKRKEKLRGQWNTPHIN
eukprot:1139913-Pelagomonas_calceolata.AAC.3